LSDLVKAVVDRETCFSYARCVEAAPDLFSLDAEGKSSARDVEREFDQMLEIAEECPMEAISLIGSDGTIKYGLNAVGGNSPLPSPGDDHQ